jgi:hypothetical protein
MYDIFFLSFDEPMADRHWAATKEKVPSARRVTGVEGIHAAHQHCAKLSRTNHFFVIDADNEILDTDFTYRVPSYDSQYVHLWYARNPLNGLTYGWGGVKLFPKKVVLNMAHDSLDMTTSFSLKIMPEVKSITHFNYAPLETWRAAFREGVKLGLSSEPEARERLTVWQSRAYGPHATESMRGAIDGASYADAHRDDPQAIRKINDYGWLKSRFESTHEV